MIRRLVLFQPITEAKAAAATAMAACMGDERLMISYQPLLVPMRLLLFDSVMILGKKRRDRSRVLPDPFVPVLAALRAATASGEVVFNVFTGHGADPSIAYSMTDAVFTVALPQGEACAWFARVGGGIAPGIAGSCISRTAAYRSAPAFIASMNDWQMLRDSASFLFFKQKPLNLRSHQVRVIEYARARLAEVPALA